MKWAFDTYGRDQAAQGNEFYESLGRVFELYHVHDRDSSGFVEKAEYEAIRGTNPFLPAWHEVDRDNSGRVEFRELLAAVMGAPIPTGVIREGPMDKRGGFMGKSWQGRYFVLKGHVLHHYDAKGKPEKGALDIRGAVITVQDKKASGRDFAFTLRCPYSGKDDDTWLSCPSAAEHTAWLDALSKASQLRPAESAVGADVFHKRRTIYDRAAGKLFGAGTHLNDRAKAFLKEEKKTAEFVHGNIELTIHEAKDLPNMDSETTGGLTDAYVRLQVDGKKGPKTSTIMDDLNPVWEEEFTIPVAGKVALLTLDVKDEDILGPEDVGSVHVRIADIAAGKLASGAWYDLNGGGRIRISARFVPAEQLAQELKVSESPFHLRDGNRIKLFQDAHIETDSPLPTVPIASGDYENGQAWISLYHAIRNATKFIYITGWSVWTETRLLRERPLDDRGLPTVGELLKLKAEQGVRILLLVWDEILSMDNKVLNTLVAATQSGMMSTHDEETRKFFEKTAVKCQLVMRHGNGVGREGTLNCVSAGLGFVGSEALFTHHQKAVVCDAPSLQDPTKRRLIGFIGGLDITNGRFDTPNHHIFSSLHDWHKGDYYQALPGFDATWGPRQPWHDIHCMLEGPIVQDIVTNFEQRWRKQAKHAWRGQLLKLEKEHDIILDEKVAAEGHQWQAQLFRSIDKFSADGIDGVEKGIQMAYIHHIRRAQRFIYIENQYFLGSSKEWEGFDDKKWNVECKHQVPAELCAKIESKIRSKEPFAAYVVLPMYPEGVPESGPVQAILYWQFKTIEFMYHRIATALKDTGSSALPTDYLNFYCLGNREPGAPSAPAAHPHARQALLCSSKRFMIYVHSKFMVVDDEFALVGSANINERSMAGDRDTEIAVGMQQPAFRCADGVLPRGEVSGFRLSCWAEHTGTYDPVYQAPHTIDCVRFVNGIADENWRLYSDPSPQPLRSHLLHYPYVIDRDGRVSAAREFFPDCDTFGAKVLGAPQNTMPNLLTT
eukprot:TRINITY_DN2272_c0_g1_i2.p1 TRINITY_DN2272_c0_g1~~TRINITY_DN2272_c0_g1_i2.p1  ORF type:complete len:1003 (+),score=261.19 TRINITY_DN2272_c0_g1_i2:254-3262(+)